MAGRRQRVSLVSHIYYDYSIIIITIIVIVNIMLDVYLMGRLHTQRYENINKLQIIVAK